MEGIIRMNKKRNTGKLLKTIKYIISAALIILIFWLVQRLLMPKYVNDVVEGALIAEYYEEEMNHDVLFIGDCEVYENFSPVVLWENYGINSYIRGSAQQLIWQSYYLLEDSLRYEKPKVVVFNVLSMKYNEPQNEAYNRMTLEGMKWSVSKINSIKASMCEDESMIEYVFPILRYHSRWNELTADDWKYLFKKKKVSHNGYYMRCDVKPAGNVPPGTPLPDYSFGSTAYEYLDKMTQLCKENDIELVLIKAPSLYPYWYDEWDSQIVEYAAEHDLIYINLLECQEDIGLNFDEDTYDGGLHLNVYGATKLSDYFGKWLMENTSLTDRRGEDAQLDKAWEEKSKFYYDEKKRMENMENE